jgi:hypothetical protein
MGEQFLHLESAAATCADYWKAIYLAIKAKIASDGAETNECVNF